MGNNLASSTAGYQRALEGISYCQTIFNGEMKSIEDDFLTLKSEGCMSGETAREYSDRMSKVLEVVHSASEKFNRFAAATAAQCEKQGATAATGLDDIEKGMAKLQAIREEIARFKGK